MTIRGVAQKKTGDSGPGRRHSWLKRVLLIAGVTILVLIAAAVIAHLCIVKLPERRPVVAIRGLACYEAASPSEEGTAEMPEDFRDGFYNVLLAGIDGDKMSTDTIIIAGLDTASHTLSLMRIPRDTLIGGDYAVPELSSVFEENGGGETGMEALREELAYTLGFAADCYMLVDIAVVEKLVDLLDGVIYDVPERMVFSDPSRDINIDLWPGRQVMTGEKAMQLLRYCSYAGQDIQSAGLQQDFLYRFAEAAITPRNATKVTPMVNLVREHMETDLADGNILAFIEELFQCDLKETETFVLPGKDVAAGERSCYVPDAGEVRELVNQSFNPYRTELPLEAFHIRTDIAME